MAFTQKLFTSYQPYSNGDTRIGELNRIWYDSNTNTFRIQLDDTPGGTIITGGSSGNGNVITNNYGNVNVAAYIDTFITPQLYSNVNLIAYLSSVTFGGNLDLGNLYITDETIGGKIADRDITLSPAGAGLVATPGIKMSVGSVVQGVSNIVAVITSTTINQVSRYSTGPSDNLNIGDYGLTNGVSGVTPGWAVYQAYGNVSFGNTIQVGDSFIGAGIPVNSTVLFVGSSSDTANANIIITSYTLNSLPPLAANTIAYTTRDVVNAGLAITTLGNTDITLNPGIGGNIVPAGSIIPLVSSVYNLGTPTRRFKELWLGAGTIYVQDETLGTDQAIGARDGNLYIAGGAGLTVGKFTLTGNTIALNNPNEEFFIGSQQATANLVINRPMSVRSPGTDFTTFSVQRDGLTTIHAPVNLGNTRAVLSIIGSSSGSIQPRNFANTMIQVTGQDNVPNRISFDAFGVSAGQNAYVAVSARAARGNVDVPTTTQAGDTILRFTGQGWTGNGLYAGSIIRLNLEAAETFTSNLKTGTRLTIATTPVGSNLIQTTAAFYSNGMNLYGNTVSTGITFADGSFQNTAVRFGDTVRKITTGVGFANPGAYQGNVTLDTTDVHTLATDSYSLTITDTGSNNLRLQLAQEISANSNPIFNNLTVSNLTVNGTFTTAINATINGKILYLANNSTSSSQIDGGGIILGNTQQSYYKSFLYDLANNWWDTGGSGVNTEFLSAHDADFAGNIFVDGTILAGGSVHTVGNLFPNAGIQVFENVNSYAQIVEQNLSPGTNATTDFIATADNGTDTTYYIDLGIAGSGYDNSSPYNSLGTSIQINDSYLYAQGNLATTPGGNLVVGAATLGRSIKFIAGGVNASDIVATFSSTSLTTPVQITSSVATGTAPLVIASTTKVNNLYANRASYADRLNPGATINGTLFDGTANISIGSNASLLTGTYLNSTVVGSSLTTVGNLVNLNVTGNVTANYVRATSHGIFNANVYTNYIVASGRYLTELPGYAYSNVNVAAYLTASNISSQVNADWTSTTGVTKILNKTGTGGPTTIALGQNAAGNVQSSGAIAIGISAAGSTTTVQGADAIAIGTNAGGSLAKAQGDASIAIGKNAGGAGYGTDGQQQWSIAIGNDAGTSNQGGYSVAVGSYAGRYNQGNYTTALGHAAGLQSQGTGAVAIGAAGYESQGAYAVAIGSGAGDTMQGNNAIAIGYQAGGDHQIASSIIINATGSALEAKTRAGLFVAPILSATDTTNALYYNTTTKEVTYGASVSNSFTSNVTTQASTLTVDVTNGPSVIFWQPSANGNRSITLSNFTAGRRIKIFITPHASNNIFTFTGVTASQCSNGVNTFVLGGGGVAQSSMMIEVFSTTSAIGGVWIFGFGNQ